MCSSSPISWDCSSKNGQRICISTLSVHFSFLLLSFQFIHSLIFCKEFLFFTIFFLCAIFKSASSSYSRFYNSKILLFRIFPKLEQFYSFGILFRVFWAFRAFWVLDFQTFNLCLPLLTLIVLSFTIFYHVFKRELSRASSSHPFFFFHFFQNLFILIT